MPQAQYYWQKAVVALTMYHASCTLLFEIKHAYRVTVGSLNNVTGSHHGM